MDLGKKQGVWRKELGQENVGFCQVDNKILPALRRGVRNNDGVTKRYSKQAFWSRILWVEKTSHHVVRRRDIV